MSSRPISSYGYIDPSFPPPNPDAGDARIIIYGFVFDLNFFIL